VLQRRELTTFPCIGASGAKDMGKAKAPSPVVAALREFFTSHGGRTLLAVSGGADSLALMTAAAEVAPLRVGVASLNHGLRPESKDEVEGVRTLAAGLGLAFHTAALGLPPGPGMEARARHARYAALEAMRAQAGYAWVATAHTSDDQAETLLMRLARGAALRGAGAIRARRGHLVRPFLGVGRAEVEAYVSAQGLTPVRDPSNVDASLLRARVRAGVLPALLEAAGPSAVKHLAAFAAQAAEDEAILSEQALLCLERARVEGGLDAVAIRSLLPPLRRRALVAWLEEAGVQPSSVLLGQLESALRRGGHTGLPGRRLLKCEGGLVRVVSEAARPEEVPLGVDAWVPFGHFRLRRDSALLPGPLAFALRADVGPLRVRGRRPGDRVEAADGRRRAVQDVLVDARVPAEQRAAWPLLVEASGRVIWVAGLWPRARTGIGGAAVRAEATSAIPGHGL
jgi:tRNA(Ile)-lysidine synthase